jgi:hypothetical protein
MSLIPAGTTFSGYFVFRPVQHEALVIVDQGDPLAVTPSASVSPRLLRSSPCGGAANRTCTGCHGTESEPAGDGPLGRPPGLLTIHHGCAQPVALIPLSSPQVLPRCRDPVFGDALPCIRRTKGGDAGPIPQTRPASPRDTPLSWGYPLPPASHFFTTPCSYGASRSPGLRWDLSPGQRVFWANVQSHPWLLPGLIAMCEPQARLTLQDGERRSTALPRQSATLTPSYLS